MVGVVRSMGGTPTSRCPFELRRSNEEEGEMCRKFDVESYTTVHARVCV